MELREIKRTDFFKNYPDNWELSKIQELLNSNIIIDHLDGNHGALYPKSSEFKSFGIPYIAANDFKNSRVDFSKCKFLSKERSALFQKGISKNGDVLFAHNATVGPVALLETKLDYVVLSTTVTYYRCNENNLSNSYLLYYFQSGHFIKQYSSVMSQSTRNQVPITAQRKLNILLPPLPEQKAIAQVLSDTDNLIEAIAQKLTKKRAIKEGAMQRLLMPKEEWKTKTILELADSKKQLFDDGDWIESEHITSDGIRLIQTGNIGVGKYVEKQNKKFIYESSFEKLNCKQIYEGDLLICRLAEPAGRACILPRLPYDKVVTSVDVTIFRPRPEIANRIFLMNIFSTSEWFKQVYESVGGTTHKRISRGSLGKVSIKLPSIEEQTRIATILCDMDTEIAQIEEKLSKYKQIKQGLMQQLLTGKIRLV